MSAVLDLVSAQVRANRRTQRLTVLHRTEGVWDAQEAFRLATNLGTEVAGHPKHPQDLIIYGYFTHGEALDALKGGNPFESKEVLGLDSPALPFRPGFAL